MPQPRRFLPLLIPHQPLRYPPHRAPHPVLHPLPIIPHLSFRLLALPLRVLPLPFALQAICADEPAECLFRGADGLVIGPFGAEGRVGCDAA